jgi:ribosomal protein L24E
MSESMTCYYCGNSFIPGSELHGKHFGVKSHKYGVVHRVCSKKCESEFNEGKSKETQEPKMDLNIGSKIVGFITLGCTVLGIAMLFQSQILLGIIIIAIGALVNFVQFKITGKKW